MSCRQVVFERGSCFIEIVPGPWSPAGENYSARMSVYDRDLGQQRPLVFADGSRVAVRGPSEPLVMQTAISYLEQQFGAQSLPERTCDADSPPPGPPLVIE
jgi:hypothetical protein